ncbi:MAG: glycosyl hydrolase-related protein [Pirellulaceae bacterium]
MSMEGEGVLVTSIRPSRDFHALMVRLFAASGEPEQVALKWADPKRVFRSDLQEARGPELEGPIELPAYGVVTLRVEPR